MEVRPGYKQTDAGVIPEEWDLGDLQHLCIKIQDGTHFSPQIHGGEFLYVTSKNIGFGVLDVSNAPRIDSTQHREIYRRCDVKKGDVLLTKDGANTGNAALNILDEEFSLLSSVAMLRFDEHSHCPSFFLQQILSSDGQRRIKDAMSGNAITRLTLVKINRLKFPFCKVTEQRAIAAALSDVDARLGGLERLIAKKRDLKQAAMQQLLTGETRLPGFHGEWEIKTLHEVCQKIQDGTHFSPKLGGNDYLYVTSRNIRFGRLDMSTAERISAVEHLKIYARCDVRKGDLLLTKDGANTGNAAINPVDEPFSLLSSVAMLRFDSRHHVSAYFMYQILSTYGQVQIKEAMSGNAITRLTLKKIRSLRFAVAPHPEQVAIAAVLSDIDAELVALEARRDKTRDLKQAMMQELLTGKTRLAPSGGAHA